MAKLFANLDRLKNSPMPNIASTAQPINYDAQPQSIKSNFANNISLADRLSQPDLRTTKHLPEFFLSDTYTGFLRIKPFGVYEHKSLTIVKQPNAVVEQGSTTVKAVNTKPAQGGSNVTQPILTVLARQGVTESNNTLNSIVTVNTPPTIVNQGGIVIQQITTTPNQGTIEIAKLNSVINQGADASAKPIPSIQSVGSLQGILSTGVSGIIVVPAKGENAHLTLTSGVDAKKVKIGSKAALDQRESKKIAAIPTLQILTYEADRILARLTPVIKHGANLQQTPTIKIGVNDVFNPSLAPTQAYLGASGKNDSKRRDERLSFISDVLDPTVTSEAENTTLKSLLGDKEYPLGDKTIKLGKVNGIEQFDPANTNSAIKKSYKQNGSEQKTSEIITQLGADITTQENNPTFDNYIILPKVPTGYTRVDSKKQLVSPKNWVLTSYKDGKLIEETVDNYRKLTNKINNIQNNQTKYSGQETVVKIARVGEGGKVVSFTAFITSLSDTTNPTYQDNQYIGRQDTTKTFKGVTRQVSIGFKAIALGSNEAEVNERFGNSKQTATTLAQKINKLQQIAGIGTIQSDQAYTLGPTLAITIAGLYKNVICTANSIKVDIPIADTPWEIGTKPLPMYYDISMDFSILTANDGNVFNTNQNFIGY